MLIRIFLIALIISWFSGILFRLLKNILKIYSIPRHRNFYSTPKAITGGLPIIISFAAATIYSFSFYSPDNFYTPEEMKKMAWTLLGVLGAAILIGLYQDKFKRWRWKNLIFQLIAGAVLYTAGFKVRALTIGGESIELGLWEFPFTLVWIVILTNFVRLFDGIDGLGLIIIIASCAFILWTTRGADEIFLHTLLAAALGSCTGMLYHNFYPSRLLLGENGNQCMGLIFASIIIVARYKAFAAYGIVIPSIVILLVIAFVILKILEQQLFLTSRKIREK